MTINLPDDLAEKVRRRAQARGTKAEAVVADAVRSDFEADLADDDLTPPPAVMAEIRRRQQDGPDVGVPLDEAFAHIRKVLAEERPVLTDARHA